MKTIQFFVLCLGLMFLNNGGAYAQDCPRGLVNDPYPGQCGRYVDTNNDGYCDHSQDLAAIQNTNTTSDTANVQPPATTATAGTEDTKQVDKSNTNKDVSGSKDNQVSSEKPANTKPQNTNRKRTDYYMWQIATVLGAGYFLSAWAAKKGKLNLIAQRKFWNAVLLITFVITAATSIFILLNSNYGIAIKMPFDIYYWHIESGWAMILISIFHVFWHFQYFKSYFARKRRQ